MIYVYTGMMASGKSAQLLEDINITKGYLRQEEILVLNAKQGFREVGYITSRNGEKHEAIGIEKFKDILDLIKTNILVKHIFLDELTFLTDVENVREVIHALTLENISLTTSGLELNCFSEPFKIVGSLLCYADKIKKFNCKCNNCEKENAIRVVRYLNGVLDVNEDSNRIFLVDCKSDNLKYSSLCRNCYINELDKLN